MRELWTSRDAYALNFDQLSNYNEPGDNVTRLETLSFDKDLDPHLDYFVTRMRGYFVPPSDSIYQFKIKSNDKSRLYFSSTGDPNDKVCKARNHLKRINFVFRGTKFSTEKIFSA